MKVIHFSNSTFQNASDRAAMRLHEQFLAAGVESHFVAREMTVEANARDITTGTLDNIQRTAFEDNLAHPFASHFQLGYPGAVLDPAVSSAIAEADIVHLHNIAGFLSPLVISRILASGKPVVWTLYDAWPFSGGCHNPAGCAQYTTGCSVCPQLKGELAHFTADVVIDKAAHFSSDNLTLLAASPWLAEAATASKVFPGRKIETVTIPVPPPANCTKAEVRKKIGLPATGVLVLFVAEANRNPRLCRENITRVAENLLLFGACKRLAARGEITAAVIGEVGGSGSVGGLSMIELSSTLAVEALRAADVAVLLTPSENLVAVALEAFAAGTPLIAFDDASLNGTVQNGVHGRLSPLWEIRRLAEDLALSIADSQMRASYLNNCAKEAAATSARDQAATQTRELYSRILEQRGARKTTPVALNIPSEQDLLPAFREACWNSLNYIFRVWLDHFRIASESADAKAKRMEELVSFTDAKLAQLEEKFRRIKIRASGEVADGIGACILSLAKLRHRLSRRLGRDKRFRWDAIQFGATLNFLRGNAIRRHLMPSHAFARLREKVTHSLAHLVKSDAVEMDNLFQYGPRPMVFERFPTPRIKDKHLPTIAIVTPSFMQGHFIERTLCSVLDQNYPKLRYCVEDAGSSDDTLEILRRHENRLASYYSGPDTGQSRAILAGFQKVTGDIMGWLNSDDVLMPGSLRFVGEFFQRNPHIDVLYGHRVVIDEHDQEVGRWVLPPHDPEMVRWIDYVPQETLFWRKSLWEKVGGVDPKFRFAIDWDLLLRFQNAGARIVRLPYFLGCFRVHSQQKTSADIGTIGAEEIQYLRWRENGGEEFGEEISRVRKMEQSRSAICQWLLERRIRI